MLNRSALAILVACTACGAETAADMEALQQGEAPLYIRDDLVWETGTISVCFEQSSPVAEQQMVRNAIEQTFEPLVNIDFTGWGTCGSGGAQIVVRESSDEWPSSRTGRRSASTSPRMWLNYFVGDARDLDGDGSNDFGSCWSTGRRGQNPATGATGRQWPTGRARCIEVIAVHEFAHALAVVHEQQRPDAPADCTEEGAREGGATEYGYYDVTSISNYCNPIWNNDGYLSPLDVAGLVSSYGMRTDDYVWYGVGNVADYGGGSINQVMFDIRAQNVSGNYRPHVGDFDGDALDDVFWYGVNGTDYIWFGEADRTFNDDIAFRQIRDGYTVGVSDFDGDGRKDISWHDKTNGDDWIWWGRADRSFDRSANPDVRFSSADIPLSGDFDGDGFGDLFMYTSTGTDRVLWGTGSRAARAFTVTTNVSGTYRPVTGDFDADGFSDIFWHGPGNSADSIWWGRADRGWDKTTTEVSGTYDVTVADVDGNGASDIIWSATPGEDTIWLFDSATRGRRWSTKTREILGGRPYGGDFDGDGLGDLLWYY